MCQRYVQRAEVGGTLQEFHKTSNDENPSEALYELCKECDDELLELAIQSISKSTRTSGTTDAKLKLCASFIFGKYMSDIIDVQGALKSIIDSAAALLRLVFAKAGTDVKSGTDVKFDLGDLRVLMEKAVEYRRGQSNKTTSTAIVNTASTAIATTASHMEVSRDDGEDDDEDELAASLRNRLRM